ncbi:hypothetical protein [Roseivirga pacifica]|uniref:hypothetical protein n=1 Tax=Roseivirga pacifica TaxID=1267423 RepID=UPI00227C0356|nr:hypothetical protein [Roseivirga pacifica]
MKSILKVPSCLIVLLFIASCGNRTNDRINNDFYFIIEGEVDSFNSKTNTFTRSYTSRKSSIQIEFSNKEKSELKTIFKEVDFLNFPDEFECSEDASFSLPAFKTTIELYDGELIKKVVQTDYCDRKINQEASDLFDEISSRIWKIIKSEKHIKSMELYRFDLLLNTVE